MRENMGALYGRLLSQKTREQMIRYVESFKFRAGRACLGPRAIREAP